MTTPVPALLPLALGLVALAPAGAAGFAGPMRTGGFGAAQRYVLKLSSGGVFRGRARETQDGWELWRNGGWTLVPTHAVLGARQESLLLAEARRMDRRTRQGDSLQRVAYADWLLDEGLFAEGLRTLDELLRGGPDLPQVPELLARHSVRVALPSPGDLDLFLASAAAQPPSVQELAALRLAQEGPIAGLDDRLLVELHHPRAARRAFAARALRRVLPGRHPRPLTARALLDVSADVRREAAFGLARVEDPAVCVPFLDALDHEAPLVRHHAAQALGNLGYPAAVPSLVARLATLGGASAGGIARSNIFVGRQFAYVQDFDVEVAQGSAIADPILDVAAEGAVLDAAALGVHEAAALEGAALRRSLSQITGASPGNTNAAWLAWWTEHGDEWMADTPPGPPSTPSRRGL